MIEFMTLDTRWRFALSFEEIAEIYTNKTGDEIVADLVELMENHTEGLQSETVREYFVEALKYANHKFSEENFAQICDLVLIEVEDGTVYAMGLIWLWLASTVKTKNILNKLYSFVREQQDNWMVRYTSAHFSSSKKWEAKTDYEKLITPNYCSTVIRNFTIVENEIKESEIWIREQAKELNLDSTLPIDWLKELMSN